MADLYGTRGPSPPGNAPPHDAEDISTFLHHLLHSTSSAHTKPMHAHSSAAPLMSPPAEDFHRFGASGINFTDPGVHFPAGVKDSTDNTFFSVGGGVDSDGNASPRRGGFSAENDLGDLSCDSEKGTGVASEVQLNLNPAPLSRTSSKRTRAAEVHNLSEKRRRSRINEKMKALQNLIPNSNKTDKASMLDEAIEYLKQLQLQVQMLSMRNGISLHPMCLPGVLHPLQLSQLGLDFDEGNGMVNSNREAGPFSANQESSRRTTFDSSDQNTPNLQNVIPSVTNITNSETPFGFEQPEYEPFNLPTSSKGVCKEVTLPQLQFNMSGSGKKSSSSGVS